MEANRQSYRAAKRAEIAERRAKVSECYLKNGWTVYRIARELGCSVATVSEDKQALTAEWKLRAQLNVEAHIATELERINRTAAQAREGYEKSCEPKKITSVSKRVDPTDSTRSVTTASATVIERPEGDPRFFLIILKCSEQRCKLLGLYQDRTAESAMKQPTTFTEFVAMHYKGEEERSGNGSTAKVARPATVELDPNRLP
jgi:predicted transcriptional regulator